LEFWAPYTIKIGPFVRFALVNKNVEKVSAVENFGCQTKICFNKQFSALKAMNLLHKIPHICIKDFHKLKTHVQISPTNKTNKTSANTQKIINPGSQPTNALSSNAPASVFWCPPSCSDTWAYTILFLKAA
jgi:hypothetical protein